MSRVIGRKTLLDTRQRFAAAVTAFVCAFSAWGVVLHTQARFTVAWSNDRLSVRAADAPISDVITEVARVTGLKVVGADKLQGRLTVSLTDLTAVEGLKALLTEVNYFVQQDPDADKRGIGLILRVHSMVHADAALWLAGPVLRVPAVDALVEAEEEDLADEKEEEAEDPEVEQENQENRHVARQLVLNGAFGNTVSVAELQRHMKSENPEIRVEAVTALAQRPIAVSLTPLVNALGDDAIEVRRTAIRALGRASDPASLLHVGLVLEQETDAEARYGALRVLALRADAAAIVHLRKVANDQDVIIREAVAQMLAEFARLAREKEGKPPPPYR